MQPHPASFCVVASFLIAFVIKQKGRTASIRNKLSHIHLGFVERRWTWLDQADERSLTKVIKALEYDDYTKTKRMKPVTSALLAQIFERRGGEESTPLNLLIKAICALAHDGLFRGGEVTGELLGTDISFGVGTMTVKVDRAKRYRQGAPGEVEVSEFPWYGSAVKLMRKWVRARKLDHRPNRFLFPEIMFEGQTGRPVGMDFAKSLSYNALVKMIRYEVGQLGLDPSEYAAHSFRAGGATDLFRLGIIRLPMIMRYGRWRSMASALLYYREESEIAREVGQVFLAAVRGHEAEPGRPSSSRGRGRHEGRDGGW